MSKAKQEGSLHKTLANALEAEIESNLNNDQFGVDSLAQSMGMSRSNLHRKLQKALGVSTSQFIREYRLKRALEILKQEEITASEVAYRVGFSSATYFSTSFQKFYGYTPGDAKHKAEDEVESPILEINTSARRKINYKKLIQFALLGVVILTVGLYYYTSHQKEKSDTKRIDAIVTDKSIAVLPLKNWTGNPDLEYVSDGMTDAVISRLTHIHSIDRVVPFTSILTYKETNKTIQEISSELGVEKVLQGNLQMAGNQIKINLQMIDGASNDHLWSEEYVRTWKTDEIFKMQREVVESIATNMAAVITEDELAYLQKIPTKNKQAYSYYLQAEFQKNKANELSYSNAIDLYQKAIAIDSNFVDSYLSMANIWNLGGGVWGFYEEREAWSNAKALLQSVLEIEPDNRQAEEELITGSFFYDWNFELVEAYYKDHLMTPFYDKSPVISLDYAIKTGRPLGALKASESHMVIDPANVFFPFFKAEALMYLGSEEDAVEMLASVDPLYNDNWFYLRESAKLYYYLGKYKSSKKHLHKLLTQFSDYPPILMWLNAVYAQMEGSSKDTNAYLGELFNEYNKGSSGSPAWFLALFYCTQENDEKTFEWLQKSYDRHEVEMTWLREEPLLAPLRTDPRYKDLYDKVGFSAIGLPIKTSSEK
ncbi:helix-turn-helix domain-containing protein [Zobellia amurskyensis]|uniref:Helix-turn-helix domain-containing protein n=1 Tax=Zobellia amurskyensis TaxID=248905 RepID=A0A7X3D238_9FLAO|nr:helix-turn-helix domain-containing protein [Zobellia amurskyensis]MUH36168.1 helix-turn-helix domain-containing protein [Zobellia amurskyensis]